MQWFRNFLQNGCQRTIIGQSISSVEHLHAGVPQDTILSPLLFSLYMNDITAFTNGDVNLFADDTSVFTVPDSVPKESKQGKRELVVPFGNLRETTKNSKTLRSRKPSVKNQDPRPDLRMIFSRQTNGVYSLKWRLTDRYLRWGTLADPRPGRGHGDKCKSSEFLQELRISGFPRF